MNIPKKLTETFYTDLNTFFSTYLTVYMHKVFNFALYQQGVNSILSIDDAFIDNEANRRLIFIFLSVHNGLIKLKYGLITYPPRKTGYFC